MILHALPELEALNGKQTKPDKNDIETTDDLFKQSHDDISSQELMDLESQMGDSDNDYYKDFETTGNDVTDSAS